MRLSTSRLLFMILLLVLFIVTTREITDPDFWWHLRTGQYIVETGTIPRADVFSYTFAGREWIAHEWLSEVFIYSIYRWTGWGGLSVAFALLVTAAFGISYLVCEKRGAHSVAAWLAVALGAWATAPVWGVRPQMFSLLLMSVFIAVLFNRMRGGGRRILWLLPPLMLLWVNLHGGFVLGLVLILISVCGVILDGVLERRPRAETLGLVVPLMLVFVACALVVPLNPNGLRMFSYPFETLASSVMQEHIEEWFSPNFHQWRFFPLAALMLGTFAALAVSPKRARASELLFLCATAYAVLRSGRHLPVFVFSAAPLLAVHATAWIESLGFGLRSSTPQQNLSRASTLLRFVVLVAAFALSVLNVRQVVARQAAVEAHRYPSSAVEYIRAQATPGPIYNWYDWGGYMIWKLYPDQRVYIDGRADVYGDAFIEEFLRTSKGEGDWREPLRRFQVRTVIVKTDSPLASLLKEEAGWSKAFEDQQAVVFVRQ